MILDGYQDLLLHVGVTLPSLYCCCSGMLAPDCRYLPTHWLTVDVLQA
jgi:hypothetical protein